MELISKGPKETGVLIVCRVFSGAQRERGSQMMNCLNSLTHLVYATIATQKGNTTGVYNTYLSGSKAEALCFWFKTVEQLNSRRTKKYKAGAMKNICAIL